jgi:hypothetical protein
VNEEVQILPLAMLACLGACLGFEINRRRNKLRKVFNTFDKDESKIADALESWVHSGQLRRYVLGEPS